MLYLPAEIQEMTEFRHDVAFCLTRNGIGVVDKAGKMIVPADYDDGEFINPERLALKSKEKWALFDFKGNRVTPFIYDKIYSWSHANCVFVHQDSVDLLIDETGKTVSTAYPFELDWQSLETTSPVVQFFYRYPAPGDGRSAGTGKHDTASEETFFAPERKNSGNRYCQPVLSRGAKGPEKRILGDRFGKSESDPKLHGAFPDVVRDERY